MRLAVYAGTSALAAAGALLKAFHQRPNFYSATVYLSQSNACVLILTNLALVCACTFIYGLQRLFYGPLRQIEIEQLTEKAWYAVLDTLLAMPSLSHDVSGWMLAIFVLLLAGKVWGWIGEGRVDILEQQPPQNPRIFHARLSSSLVLSIIFDACMLQYCIKTVRDNPRPGMMVIFTFEFAILTIFSLFTFSRYLLALVEARILKTQTEQKIEERRAEIRAERERLQQDHAQATASDEGSTTAPANLPSEDDVDENEIDVPGWEEKRRWLFGLELATDFTKLIIYTIFFAISLTFMGLPMHIMRDVYLTFSAFAKRIQDYNNYRRATQNMNDRYSDATAEELSNDNTCIVCRETMVPWEQPEAANVRASSRLNEGLRAKKLPCGHILHLRCLKAWLERQQACPTCRRPVISSQPANAPIPGQPRIEGPNGGGQPAAPGANAQPGGNNGEAGPGQPAPPANRLRMLNLGPIRIGVYNGPAHQVQEALAQRRNAQAQGQATAGSGGPTNVSASALGNQSTQIQLMQVEERLIREARSLAVEQTQLLTVRALEAELARLRGLHDRVQNTSSATPQAPAQAPAGFPVPMPMQMPIQMPPPMPFAGGAMQLPQVLQPLPGHMPLGAGNPSIPPGMTLPDGWTLTPMHRVGGPSQQGQAVPRPLGNEALVNVPSVQQNSNSTNATAQATTSLADPVPSLVQVSTQAETNEAVPAEHIPHVVSVSSPPLASSVRDPPSGQQPVPANAAEATAGEAAVEPQPPSRSEEQESQARRESPSWSFEDITNPTTGGSSSSSEAGDASTVRPDKGKAKAVTLEDVDDDEEDEEEQSFQM